MRIRRPLVACVVALFVLFLFLRSGSSGVVSDASVVAVRHDRFRPVVVSERSVPASLPFDSSPFPAFVPTKVVQVSLVKFPSEDTLIAAYLLDLPFPTSYKSVICENALFVNRLWEDGYATNMSCGNARPAPNSGVAVVDKDLALGYDPAHITFQHDMITGISHGAMFAEWVAGDTAQRGVLCHRVVCEILKASVGAAALERGKLPKLFWARSVRYSVAPGATTMDGCEPFPLGSFWPVETFLRQLRVAGKLKSRGGAALPRVLFLSRGTGKSSIRWLDNEDALVAALQALCRARGWRLDVVPHETTAVSASTTGLRTVEQFYGAAAVVGLHGGAFSNIVFCQHKALIVELNNNVKGRDCFSGISVSRGLRYHRFQMHRELFYQSWDHLALHEREIRQIVAIVDVGLRQMPHVLEAMSSVKQ